MKLGVVPENLIERLALFSGLLPRGIFESWFGIMRSRTMMVADKKGQIGTFSRRPHVIDDARAAGGG